MKKIGLAIFLVSLVAFLSSCGGGGGGGGNNSGVSSSKAITAFSLDGVTGVINENAKTISVTMPYSTNVTASVATFTTTGASVKIGSTVQISGTTANYFTDQVVYTVTAADNSTAAYVVTVSRGVSLPKTGQITSYAIGDDGDLQKGVTWPNPRFTAGTGAEADCVTDSLTGLMWLRASDTASRTWPDALTYANGLSICGHDDWRLPNINELESLHIYRNADSGDPIFNAAPVIGDYWSSTSLDSGLAWFIEGSGTTVYNSKIPYPGGEWDYHFVLPVRSNLVETSPARVAKTGQTTSYATGDDGDLQKGVTWSDPRFTVGTGAEADCVSDNLSGLTWAKSPNIVPKTWADALTYANGLSLCGFDDWRLPNINELRSLVNYGKGDYNSLWLSGQGLGPVMGYSYWSSTSNKQQPEQAFQVDMNFGGVVAPQLKTETAFTWPVHSGHYCGDTAGLDSSDVPCSCGDKVVTDTLLSSSDPVTNAKCAGPGLSLAAGVTLDLGGFTLNGLGKETGIEILGNATVTNGFVNEFNVGVLIHPTANLTMNNVHILNNTGTGIEVNGQLAATAVEIGSNGGNGILVETAAPVKLQSCSIHNNGQAGVYVLAASHADGFVLSGLGSNISNNSGDGVILGDLTAQTGIVRAQISDAEITGNQTGISVAQTNSTTLRTSHRILANNIHSNKQSGLYIRTSYQWYMDMADSRAMSSNDVHHNAIQGDGCIVGTDIQTAPQIVFDGPIATADPAVSISAPEAGPDLLTYPEDYRCYWGADTTVRIATQEACISLNDPMGTESEGINNHCIWNGTQCRIAWQAGGAEGAGTCDFSRNRVYAYVNDSSQPPLTQKGVVALNGAYVNARRNSWGVGGPLDGIFTDPGSLINAENDCGSVAMCP